MSTQEDLKIAITVLLKSGSGKLTFRNKRLQNIPNNIDQFKFLTSLDLRSNLLITLPHAFSKLSQLQSLNLRRNQFQHLPSALQYLSTLQTLHLSENQLDFLEPTIIASLCNLQQFSVNHNHLRSLPSSISCLMKLEVLNVSHNTIAELPESICNLRKLKLLDAGFNRLTCLPYYMGEIIALEKVYLQKNQLLELPESFTDLLNLQVVDVAANQIRILPTKFSELRLTELHIEANPLLQLRAVPSLQEEEVLPLKELAARFVMKHMQDKRSFLRLSIRSYPELKDLLSQCSTCALCQGAFLNTWLECVRFVDVKSQQSSADRSSSSSNISKLRIPERVLLCSYACFNAPEHEFYGVANTIDLSKLSPEEKWQVEHRKLHLEHKGHEKMHLEMFLILLTTLVLAQVALVQWRNRHFRSYQMATLLGMWVIPLGVSLRFLWWRFIFIWIVFSLITGTMTFMATRKPLTMTTPRRVYTWYLLVYKFSYGLGILGYVIIMGTLFGLNVLLFIKPNTAMDWGLLLLFYGLYYGVIARDFAEVCSEKMASHIGYFTSTGVPTRRLNPNVCAICGNDFGPAEEEPIYKLNCGHVFHDFCIRGWCIVGKKETCPYCKEKVDLKKMFKNPWEKPHVLYGNLLDWIRYLVAWQPIIVILVQGINWALGLH